MSSPVLSAVREDSAVNSSGSSGPRAGGPRPRRSFTPVQKLEFLAAYEKACENNEGGAFLRREGLYSSQMTEWRRFRDAGVWAGKKAGESIGKLTAEQAENARLGRQLEVSEGKRLRPSGESQYSRSPTTQSNSGTVSTVRRRGPEPLVPLAQRTWSAPNRPKASTCGLGPKSTYSSIASSRRRSP